MLEDLLVPQKVMPRSILSALKVLQNSATSAIVGFRCSHEKNAFPLEVSGRSLLFSRQRESVHSLLLPNFFAASPSAWILSKERNPTLMSEKFLTYFLFGGLHEQK